MVGDIRACGIENGDHVLIHSNITPFGDTPDKACSNLFNAVREIVGSEGSVWAPGFFYEYARENKPFDTINSPPSRELGLFPAWFFKHKNATRSFNPLTSLMWNKYKYDDFMSGNGYGPGSGFDILTNLNGKMLFAGTGLRDITYVHYAESKIGVPHLYNKLYKTKIYMDGHEMPLPITCQVRYRNIEVPLDQDGNESKIRKMGKPGLLKESGHFKAIEMKAFLEFALSGLRYYPHFFLKSEPKFKEGEIPLV